LLSEWGGNSMVEYQPFKLRVAGSSPARLINPTSKSTTCGRGFSEIFMTTPSISVEPIASAIKPPPALAGRRPKN
jgi:hypothetical protein